MWISHQFWINFFQYEHIIKDMSQGFPKTPGPSVRYWWTLDAQEVERVTLFLIGDLSGISTGTNPLTVKSLFNWHLTRDRGVVFPVYFYSVFLPSWIPRHFLNFSLSGEFFSCTHCIFRKWGAARVIPWPKSREIPRFFSWTIQHTHDEWIGPYDLFTLVLAVGVSRIFASRELTFFN